MELDKERLFNITKEIDREAVSPELVKLTTSPSFYLKQVFHVWEKYLQENLNYFDLTKTQFSLLSSLVALTKDGRVVTQMDLANYLKADKMMVSEVLRALEWKGFIFREDHPDDRRAKSIAVTKKGIDIFEIAIREFVRFDEEFFSVLGDDKDEFIRILKKFL